MNEKKIRGVRRGRKLTPEEAKHYRRLREAADAEVEAIRTERATVDEPTGPGSLEDLLELRQVFAALKTERERQGLSLSEIQQ